VNVLFILPYPIQAPSSRYRVYQYLPYLQANGINITVSRFIDSDEFFKVLYQPGRTTTKAAYFAKQTIRRFWDIGRSRGFDAVFVQREALPFGPAIVEQMIARLGCPILYDFDDAIYLRRSSNANRWASWLKQPQKTAKIIQASQHVIVGNQVLHEYASKYTKQITLIPSSIDAEFYQIRPPQCAAQKAQTHKPIVIGWVGSGTNLQYVAKLANVLRTLNAEHNIEVQIVGGTVEMAGVNVVCRPWRLENELSDLQGFDIGIMPLADEPWTRGKGGFKAIQYMGVGLPVVASPVGINSEIVTHDVTGFLAKSDEAWHRSLTTLITDAALRTTFGLAGRKRVEERYCTAVNGPKLLQVLQSVKL